MSIQTTGALDPFDEAQEIRTESDLTRAIALAASQRYAQQDGAFDQGTDEARLFGAAVEELRARRGWGRLELARRAALNPVYVILLEGGVLAPDEIPSAVVARLSQAFGRRQTEWPVLPWVAERSGEETNQGVWSALREQLGAIFGHGRFAPALAHSEPGLDDQMPRCPVYAPRGGELMRLPELAIEVDEAYIDGSGFLLLELSFDGSIDAARGQTLSLQAQGTLGSITIDDQHFVFRAQLPPEALPEEARDAGRQELTAQVVSKLFRFIVQPGE